MHILNLKILVFSDIGIALAFGDFLENLNFSSSFLLFGDLFSIPQSVLKKILPGNPERRCLHPPLLSLGADLRSQYLLLVFCGF